MNETEVEVDRKMAIFDDPGVEKQIRRREGVVRVGAKVMNGSATTACNETRDLQLTSKHLSAIAPTTVAARF